jgi:D-amino-acid dehydrogenase
MKIVVVGSGLLGTTTAYFLSRHGHAVTVLDRADGPGMETSFANGGMLTPSQADPWNAPGVLWKALFGLGKEDAPLLLRLKALPSLGLWGLEFLRNSARGRYIRNALLNARLAGYTLGVLHALRSETDLRYDQSAHGTLKVFRERHSLDRSAGLAEVLSHHGVAYRLLDRAQVVEVEPALAPIREAILGGIHYPGDEAGDAHQFCRALSEASIERGVEFLFRTTVRSFQCRGNRLLAADTTAGPLQADAFVVAAGSYSPLLLKPLGIQLPIRPVKGYSITLPRGTWQDGPRIPVVDDALHAAITPLGDRLRVAGTAELTGYDDRITDSRVRNLFTLLGSVYPEYRPALGDSGDERWTGFRPMTPDGVPVLGRSCYENLYLNTGHGHLGWSMAAGSGKAVADLISGEAPEIDLSGYRFERFWSTGQAV